MGAIGLKSGEGQSSPQNVVGLAADAALQPQGLPPVLPVATRSDPLSALTMPTIVAKQVAAQGGAVGANPGDLAVEAWVETLTKLFSPANGIRNRLVYDHELGEVEKKLEVPAGTLLECALQELRENVATVALNKCGQIVNSEVIGEAFDAVYQLANQKMAIAVAVDLNALVAKEFPLGKEMTQILEPIIEGGNAVVVMVAKEPPLSAAEELRRIADSKFGGLISLWEKRELWDVVGISPALKDYLEHATVRVLSTGADPEHNRLARSVNCELEQKGGFEDRQWASLVKGVTQGDRHHALKGALAVCAPVVIGVKALESYAPGLMHSVGGMLDDLFGAIIPDVSQSMGKKGAPFKERFKEAWPVLREGLTSLPVALGLGWGAAALYGATQSTLMHGISGALFALACSAGTVGTSIGAYRKASGTIEKLRTDPLVGEYIEALGTAGRVKLALQESIFDVPFRVGHTVIGVPLQIGLGVAAGVGGFFHNGLFVMTEGMLETVLGAAAAFGLPGIKALWDRSTLKQIKPGKDS